MNNSAQMDEFCRDKGFTQWFETSAKENINIDDAARSLVAKVSARVMHFSSLFGFEHSEHRNVRTETDGVVGAGAIGKGPTNTVKTVNGTGYLSSKISWRTGGTAEKPYKGQTSHHGNPSHWTLILHNHDCVVDLAERQGDELRRGRARQGQGNTGRGPPALYQREIYVLLASSNHSSLSSHVLLALSNHHVSQLRLSFHLLIFSFLLIWKDAFVL